MIVTSRFSPFFKPLALAAALASASSVHSAEIVADAAVHDPRAFNLSLYMWFPGLDGNFTAGPLNDLFSLSFIDIADKLSSFPMAFNGHYERLGFYLDGNYMGMDF
jgi:hypothetical protein